MHLHMLYSTQMYGKMLIIQKVSENGKCFLSHHFFNAYYMHRKVSENIYSKILYLGVESLPDLYFLLMNICILYSTTVGIYYFLIRKDF